MSSHAYSRPLKNVGEAAKTRQKLPRKRSLRAVNEHFEAIFNAVLATQVVFQRPDRAERGAVLLVMLVMLVILMVIVASMVNTGSVNLQIIGNQQYRYEAKLTVQNAIETFISNPDNFSASPPAALPVGMDLDGDGTDEYTASAPTTTCLSTVRIKPAELNVANAADRSCFNSQNLQIWIDGALPPESNCQSIVWDVSSQVADAGTGAQVELHQGIAQRAKIDVACP